MHLATTRLAIISLAGLLVGSGCDQLTSTTFAVSALTRTPAFSDSLPSDLSAYIAGIAPEGVTAVAVGVGKRDSVVSTNAPKPVTGAEVTLAWGANQVSLCPAGTDGTYEASNLGSGLPCADAQLDYAPGATYTTTVKFSGDSHTVRVQAPNRISDTSGVGFDPPLGSLAVSTWTLSTHPRNTALTINWQDVSGAAGKNVFVVVVRINGDFTDLNNWSSSQPDPGNPVFDNAPQSPAAMVDMITNEPPTSETIPSDVFNQQGLYSVILTPVELSTDTSGLSIGSGAVAGWGTGIVFIVDT
jgi:hypothetical protein